MVLDWDKSISETNSLSGEKLDKGTHGGLEQSPKHLETVVLTGFLDPPHQTLSAVECETDRQDSVSGASPQPSKKQRSMLGGVVACGAEEENNNEHSDLDAAVPSYGTDAIKPEIHDAATEDRAIQTDPVREPELLEVKLAKILLQMGVNHLRTGFLEVNLPKTLWQMGANHWRTVRDLILIVVFLW